MLPQVLPNYIKHYKLWFGQKLNILRNVVTKSFENELFSRLLASDDHPKGDLHLTLSIYGQVNK